MASAAIARKRAEMGPVDDDSDHEESYDDFDLPFRDPNFPLRLFTNNEVEGKLTFFIDHCNFPFRFLLLYKIETLFSNQQETYCQPFPTGSRRSVPGDFRV